MALQELFPYQSMEFLFSPPQSLGPLLESALGPSKLQGRSWSKLKVARKLVSPGSQRVGYNSPCEHTYLWGSRAPSYDLSDGAMTIRCPARCSCQWTFTLVHG